MATATLCKGCGERHDPMLTCSRAARLSERMVAQAPRLQLVAHARAKAVVQTSPATVQTSKHGKHKDPARNRADTCKRMREMRAKRKAPSCA